MRLSIINIQKNFISAVRHGKLPHFDPLTFFAIAIALLVALPIFSVLGSVFASPDASSTNSAVEVWNHLFSTVLGTYISNSLWLMLGVGVGVLPIGVGTAWLVSMCRFPGVRLFEWLLLLPLAAPAYLLAYVYTEWLEYYGPVQAFLRSMFGWQSVSDYWFPHVRSLEGAIVMLTLVLYPYVYLLTRVAFLEQSSSILEATRSLGCNPWQSFWSAALPMARPAIASGLALALMETLNDYGTVEFFGVSTFTTGIYRTWFGLGERVASAQLAAMLVVFVVGLILIEQFSRRQAQYYQTSNRYRQETSPYNLSGMRAILAILACSLPIVTGFILPTGILLHLAIANPEVDASNSFWSLSQNSFFLAAIAAVLAISISLLLAYGQRLRPNWKMLWASRFATMGYAIPGSTIAVGILVPLGQFDNAIDSFWQKHFGISTGLLLSGTIAALIFAYLVRFLAVSSNAVVASLSKIEPNLDEASHSLGHGNTSTLLNIHLPLIWGGILTGALLVFVDVMKELSATIVIRPFNFETLSVRVYQYASDERLAEAAMPALAILLVGLIPVLLLSWRITRSRANRATN